MNVSIPTTSSYDALNRISTKTYSDSTPPVTYTYDATTATNSIGHLTSVSNSNSTTNYTSFDPMGRVTASTQVTGGQSYSFAYAYNLAGSLKTESYPSGRVATTVYDNANHATSLTGALAGNNTNYVSGATYWPHGAEWLLTYGNNVVPVYSYNNRLQTSNAYATIGNSGSQYLLYLGYNWGTSNNNGNLQSSSEGYGASVPSGSLSWLSQNYSYDAVNRVTSVSDTGYSRTFGYDAYGNAWVKTNIGVPLAGNTPTSNVFNGNNQIGGGSYDAAGNQLGVNGDTAAYDAESRQISLTEPASLGSGVENYLYDGNGQRVEKTGPDGATIYVYDAAGRVAAEYGTSALASPCTTCYMVTDNLGTARLVTDAGANVISRHDYLPFGEEIAGGTAGRSSVWGPEADTVSRKFTGKERDTESGLDYFGARYYGSALGRWTSPDQVNLTDERIKNPSSTINKYVYGGNSPLKFIDPDGNDITLFYDPTTTGHIGLVAYDPAKGTGTFESFGPGPGSRGLGDRVAQIFGQDVDNPITNGHVSDFATPDYFREHYATLTIATSPEVTEQVVNYINSHSDGNWNLYTNNCADACQRVLQQIKAGVSGGTPNALWTSLLRKYGKKNALTSLEIAGAPVGITGKEFGSPRKGIDPFAFIPLLALHCETTTVTFIENGRVTSTESHQNCHL